jgi:Outer membrane efflux protein
MYRIISLSAVFTCLLSVSLSAQQTDFNRVVLPVDQKAKDFREFLVQLSWLNNPDNDVYAIEVENAKDQIKVTKKDWLKDIQVTSNINEANIKTFFKKDDGKSTVITEELVNGGVPVKTSTVQSVTVGSSTVITTTNTEVTTNGGKPVVREITSSSVGAADNIFFPRYNLGINVNLGTIMTQKPKNRIRERELHMIEHQLNQRKLRMRAETLERYENLLAANEIYKTRVQIEQDAKANYVLVGSLYKTDEMTFVEYNEASSLYFSAVETRIKTESERRIALIRLEEIIGLTWDQVKHTGKEPNL